MARGSEHTGGVRAADDGAACTLSAHGATPCRLSAVSGTSPVVLVLLSVHCSERHVPGRVTWNVAFPNPPTIAAALILRGPSGSADPKRSSSRGGLSAGKGRRSQWRVRGVIGG